VIRDINQHGLDPASLDVDDGISPDRPPGFRPDVKILIFASPDTPAFLAG
jgi:hypothetical protein